MMTSRSAPGAAEPEAVVRPTTSRQLFLAFTGLALQAFGGVLGVAQRVLCDRKRWLTRLEFVEMLSLGQILPGPNVCNLSLMVGDRFLGWRGALASLSGLLACPLAIVLLVAAVYDRFASVPAVAGALRGMGAASAGLIVGTALKLVPTLRTNPLGVPSCTAIGVAAFVLVGPARLPLAWVVLGLGAAGCALAWRRTTGGRP